MTGDNVHATDDSGNHGNQEPGRKRNSLAQRYLDNLHKSAGPPSSPPSSVRPPASNIRHGSSLASLSALQSVGAKRRDGLTRSTPDTEPNEHGDRPKDDLIDKDRDQDSDNGEHSNGQSMYVDWASAVGLPAASSLSQSESQTSKQPPVNRPRSAKRSHRRNAKDSASVGANTTGGRRCKNRAKDNSSTVKSEVGGTGSGSSNERHNSEAEDNSPKTPSQIRAEAALALCRGNNDTAAKTVKSTVSAKSKRHKRKERKQQALSDPHDANADVDDDPDAISISIPKSIFGKPKQPRANAQYASKNGNAAAADDDDDMDGSFSTLGTNASAASRRRRQINEKKPKKQKNHKKKSKTDSGFEHSSQAKSDGVTPGKSPKNSGLPVLSPISARHSLPITPKQAESVAAAANPSHSASLTEHNAVVAKLRKRVRELQEELKEERRQHEIEIQVIQDHDKQAITADVQNRQQEEIVQLKKEYRRTQREYESMIEQLQQERDTALSQRDDAAVYAKQKLDEVLQAHSTDMEELRASYELQLSSVRDEQDAELQQVRNEVSTYYEQRLEALRVDHQLVSAATQERHDAAIEELSRELESSQRELRERYSKHAEELSRISGEAEEGIKVALSTQQIEHDKTFADAQEQQKVAHQHLVDELRLQHDDDILSIRKSYDERIAQLQSKLDNVQTELNSALARQTSIEHEHLMAMQELTAKHHSELSQLKLERTEVVSDMHNQIVASRAELVELRAEFGNSQTRHEAEIQRLRESHNEELLTLRASHVEAVSSLQDDLDAKNATIERLIDERRAIDERNDANLASLRQEHADALNTVEAEHSAVESELQGRLTDLRKDIEMADHESQSKHAENIANMKAEHRSELESTCARHAEALSALQHKLDDALSELKEVQSDRAHIAASADQERQKHETATHLLEEQLHQQQVNHEKTVDELVARHVVDVEQQQSLLHAARDELRAVKSRLDANLASHSDEVERLRDEISQLAEIYHTDKDNMQCDHDTAIAELRAKHEREIELLKVNSDRSEFKEHEHASHGVEISTCGQKNDRMTGDHERAVIDTDESRIRKIDGVRSATVDNHEAIRADADSLRPEPENFNVELQKQFKDDLTSLRNELAAQAERYESLITKLKSEHSAAILNMQSQLEAVLKENTSLKLSHQVALDGMERAYLEKMKMFESRHGAEVDTYEDDAKSNQELLAQVDKEQMDTIDINCRDNESELENDEDDQKACWQTSEHAGSLHNSQNQLEASLRSQEDTEVHLSDARQTITALRTEIGHVREQLQAAIAQKEIDVDAFRVASDQARAETEQMRTELQSLSGRMASLTETQEHQLHQVSTAAETALKALKVEHETEVATLKKQSKTSEEANEDLCRRNAELNQRLEEMDEEVSSTNETVAQLQSRIDAMAPKEDVVQANEELQNWKVTSTEREALLHQKINDLETELRCAEDEHAELRGQMKEHMAALAETQLENEQLKGRLAEKDVPERTAPVRVNRGDSSLNEKSSSGTGELGEGDDDAYKILNEGRANASDISSLFEAKSRIDELEVELAMAKGKLAMMAAESEHNDGDSDSNLKSRDIFTESASNDPMDRTSSQDDLVQEAVDKKRNRGWIFGFNAKKAVDVVIQGRGSADTELNPTEQALRKENESLKSQLLQTLDEHKHEVHALQQRIEALESNGGVGDALDGGK